MTVDYIYLGSILQISIHIPYKGYDVLHRKNSKYVILFQSTYPIKGMTCWRLGCLLVCFISIHIPYKGYDLMGHTDFSVDVISIHIPYKGYDLGQDGNVCKYSAFQSTYPIKGMTADVFHRRTRILFQSTYPIKGMTLQFLLIAFEL